MAYNFLRTNHSTPREEIVRPSDVFTNFSVIAQGGSPGKFPLHTSARKSAARRYPASIGIGQNKGIVLKRSHVKPSTHSNNK